MNYFDFHLHPTLKTTLKEDLPYDSQIPGNAVSGIVGCCTDLPQIVASQASVSQLMRFEQKLLGIALYSLESVIAGDKTLNSVARSNKKLSKYVNPERLQAIADNTIKAYDYLTKILLPAFQQKPEFRILDKYVDFAALDPSKIHVFFVLEGCHSLCNSSNTVYDKTEIIQNLKELASKIPLVSVNITHLQKSTICNQAFGIQLTNNSTFIPSGNGITKDGEEVIQACYDLGICVDIKHMSLIARKQLFRQIKEGKYKTPQPVICTHAGFTGIPSSDIRHYVLAYEEKGGAAKIIYGKPNHRAPSIDILRRPAPAFNASSINIYDEEIAAIVANGGLIGLSLDRRIGGFVSQYDEDPYAFFNDETFVVDKEYFSQAEFQQLGITRKNISSRINDSNCNMKSDLLEASEVPSMLEEFHRQHIMLQLKHYLQVCINHKIPLLQAQTQICIGSDFDGIINPFYCVLNVDALPQLYAYLKKNFQQFLGNYTDSRAWRAQLNVDQFIDKLFYQNGHAFIKKQIEQRAA